LPTYTGQSELLFVHYAGQGEFPRLIVAPGDAREAVYWSAVAMKIAWEYQIPAFILSDKTLSEGIYSTDLTGLPEVPPAAPALWDGQLPYKRYTDAPDGISPLAFPGTKNAVVKVNSYVHEEDGITSEEGDVTVRMTRKRIRKEGQVRRAMQEYPAVIVDGVPNAKTALISWGSTKGVCNEVALRLGLRSVRPVVLAPFPVEQVKRALDGVQRLIIVEENATSQLAGLTSHYGIHPDETILRYDGRPFTFEDLLAKVQEVMK
jgi:2-oxoglutarate ferredoxin oxidoreductase subunit alpha